VNASFLRLPMTMTSNTTVSTPKKRCIFILYDIVTGCRAARPRESHLG
jgi:hypothetical protein